MNRVVGGSSSLLPEDGSSDYQNTKSDEDARVDVFETLEKGVTVNEMLCGRKLLCRRGVDGFFG